MNSPAILLIIFLVGALVAIVSGIANSSPPIVALGIAVAAIGVWLTYRNRRVR